MRTLLMPLLLAVACLGCEAVDPSEYEEEDQALWSEEDQEMGSPLFVKTPIVAVGTSDGWDPLTLYTATDAPVLIEYLTFNGGMQFPVETDAGKFTLMLYNLPLAGTFQEYIVPAHDPAVDGTNVQGRVRLDLVIPPGWTLIVQVSLATTGGAPNSQNLAFTIHGGELG